MSAAGAGWSRRGTGTLLALGGADRGTLPGADLRRLPARRTLEGEERRIEADHLLAFFGLSMNLGPIADWGLDLERNLIVVDPASYDANVNLGIALQGLGRLQLQVAQRLT